MSIEVVITIIVDGIESTDADLKKLVLDSRSKMCEVFNNGWIDRYNETMQYLGLDNAEMYPAYQEAYTLISNEYWTKLLYESGKYTDLRIVDEILIPTEYGYYDCRITLERI